MTHTDLLGRESYVDDLSLHLLFPGFFLEFLFGLLQSFLNGSTGIVYQLAYNRALLLCHILHTFHRKQQSAVPFSKKCHPDIVELVQIAGILNLLDRLFSDGLQLFSQS